MNLLSKSYHVLRLLGPGFVALRLKLRMDHALGRTRRAFPNTPWNSISLESILQIGVPGNPADYEDFKLTAPPPFLFPLGEPPTLPASMTTDDSAGPLSLAERIELLANDRCTYFFRQPSQQPINWHQNALDGRSSDAHTPWYALPHFSDQQGDIRTMWEPSRAAWAIDLARGRARGVDLASADLFNRWLDSWLAANPPWLGTNWSCGQEASVRFIAIVFGFWAFAKDETNATERWTTIAKLAWATGHRIERHIGYAISQRNNHALSEACGLMLIAHLFPELRKSSRWMRLGQRVFSQQLRCQMNADGTYIQHSMNYHRVMMHISLLALRIGELANRPFGRELYNCLDSAAGFVFQMMDRQTGRLPNYGHNDGACVLPLSDCDYSDYRPVLQAAHYLVHRERILPPGPWDEDLNWLFGSTAIESDPSPPAKAMSTPFRKGGYYTLRKDESWAMIRCNTFRERPGQYDPLHVDLWWRGINVLHDNGTHSYFTPGRPELERYFKSAAAHNTVEIDGVDPLELVSRFLMLPWPRAKLRHYEPDGALGAWLEGEQTDYDRRPWKLLHRRALIALRDDAWVIVDDLFPRRENIAVLRWQLVDAPYQCNEDSNTVHVRTQQGDITLGIGAHPAAPTRLEVIRGRDEPSDVKGFESVIYQDRTPTPVLEAEFPVQQAQRIVTSFCPGNAKAPALVAQSDRMQRWDVGPTGNSWIIELATPTRSATRILCDSHGTESSV